MIEEDFLARQNQNTRIHGLYGLYGHNTHYNQQCQDIQNCFPNDKPTIPLVPEPRHHWWDKPLALFDWIFNIKVKP